MASAESNSATHLHLLTLLLLTISLPNRSLSIRIPDRVSTAIRNPPPDYPLKIAVFALGCFWRSEAVFGCLNGVVRTTVGYCGGSKLNPVYRSLGDHAESVQVEYDPKVISYTQLLEVFWASHDSRQVFGQGPDVGNQYRSVIFTNGTEERRLAGVSKEREQLKSRSSVVVTQIQQLGTFYPAEPEHQIYTAIVEVLENAGKIFGGKFEAYFKTFGQCQHRMSNIVLKFELKQSPFLRQLMGNLPEVDLENSSLAAKLNGYAAELCPPGIQKQIDAKINDILRKGWPVLRDV
uniref:Peptide methionine sulfoxide reductase A5 n=1 Tax=Salix viminalis TaxID=40686 RepID=A0A6N2LA98_SALVM